MHIREAMKLLGLVAALVVLILVVIQSEQAWLAQADCTIIVQPGQSIQKVIDQAQAGAVVCLSPGTFQENIQIKKSLTLRGAGRMQAVIKGKVEKGQREPGPPGVQMTEPVVRIESASEIEVNIKGLTIAEAEFYGPPPVTCDFVPCFYALRIPPSISVGGHAKATIRSSTVSRSGSGLAVGNSAQVSLIDSQVSDNSGSGISVTGSSGDAKVTIQSSIVSGNGVGLDVQDSAKLEVNDSRFLDNRQCGIRVLSADARISGTPNEMRDNGVDLCGFAPVALRRPLVPQTTRTQLTVPQDFASLQEAVDALAPGGTILVGLGIYEVGLTIWKPLTLWGVSRTETTLKVRPERGLVVSVPAEVQVVTLQGLAVLGGGLNIYGYVYLQDVQVSGNRGSGLFVGGSAQVSLTGSQVSTNVGSGLSVEGSAQVSLIYSQVSTNVGSGLSVGGSARVSLSGSTIFGNTQGLVMEDSARAEVRQSLIIGNGTNPEMQLVDDCQAGNPRRKADIMCGGIVVGGTEARLTLIGSIIQGNADWGLGAELKQCGGSEDKFTGKVVFEGTNTIEGNNRSGKLIGKGNPGNHPFKNLPDGQVCLP
ncbi:right-handed parallel beta-helix repeat-containing protein [Candidatus Acetothermia bacterium]|nr:right-handed parallel beta-helix repeat-containing protein [Candidatus Acetothermia bacterium]